jgi:peptide/nickel transport system substrate-binding protein/oligopeptide transport system substrate-binding protein
MAETAIEQGNRESLMLRSIYMAFCISLWICPYMLNYDPSGLAESMKKSELERPGAKFGGIYRQMLGDNPSTLDPAFVTDIYSRAVINQLFDGLVQFDPHLNVIPAIAEFWEASQDGRTWTFSLRRGVKFHHGREVTAQDFVYSFTRLLHVNSPGPVTDLFEHIQGAKEFMQGKTPRIQGLKALDRYTFQMALEEPFASLLAVLGVTNAAVVPREEVERLGQRFGHAPVGTGPFKFVRWVPNQEIVLRANDDYYEGRPFLDAVVLKIVVGSKQEERFAEFLKGNLEEAIIPSAKAEEVHTDARYRQYQRFRKPWLSLLYIGFNMQLKPFDDKRVRQAFNYAVNKEAIVQEITKSGALTATGALPPGMPGYDPDLPGYAYNPDKAKQLLAEAGYPGGAGFPVVQLWSVHQAETTKAELSAYRRYLADLGVQVEIHYAPDWPTYKAMLQQGKLPMFRLIRLADIPDPDNFLAPMLHSASPTNYTFSRNPLVDRLLEQARREVDDGQRLALYREVERLVMDDAPWITQNYFDVLEYLYQPYVQGAEVGLLGKRAVPLKKIWFKGDPTEGATTGTSYVRPNQ